MFKTGNQLVFCGSQNRGTVTEGTVGPILSLEEIKQFIISYTLEFSHFTPGTLTVNTTS